MKVGLFITNQQTLDTDMVSALDDQFAMVRLARDCGWEKAKAHLARGVLRYRRAPIPQNRFFFLERNVTMSALTEATIIVEASETSGTLTQARAALYQGR